MPPPPAVAASADEIVFVERPSISSLVPSESVFTAIGLIVCSTIFFSAGDISAKLLTQTLPSVQVAFLRYAVFVALVVPTLLVARGRSGFATRRPGLQVLRGLGVVVSSVLFMLGLQHLEVAEA